jgi:hypothetical protein
MHADHDWFKKNLILRMMLKIGEKLITRLVFSNFKQVNNPPVPGDWINSYFIGLPVLLLRCMLG